MKKTFLPFVYILLISFAVAGCGKSSSSNNNNNNNNNSGATITIYGMSFSPASKTVAKGTVVTWSNNDSYAHTATSDDGSTFDTGNIAGGASATYTANTAGTFTYHCLIHGTAMSGTLIVTP